MDGEEQPQTVPRVIKRQLPVTPLSSNKKKSERKALSTSSLVKDRNPLKKNVSTSAVVEAAARLSDILPGSGSKPRVFMGYSTDTINSSCNWEDSSVVVAVRVRPFSEREIRLGAKQVVKMHSNETIITSKDDVTHQFCYDHCFWSFDDLQAPYSDQTNVYTELAQPLLDWAFQGYNTCLFAYGQTGSGKSYCIMGEPNCAGIVPQFAKELYSRIEGTTDTEINFKVEVSYYEIYKERIHDLLASTKHKSRVNLRVREHPVMGPYVEDLSTYIASSYSDVEEWLALGNRFRATAATCMNDRSSRSHSVFTLLLTQTSTTAGKEQHSKVSRINLIDLAGSERSNVAMTSGERLQEGASINKSLHTLGKVISLLSEKSTGKRKTVYIPYRDSTLTWLLKDSLGGNSKTAMIATISPADLHHDESLSTLRYAQQARSIVNIARINEDPSSRLIRELRQEIEWLRTQLGLEGEDILEIMKSQVEVKQLKEKLKEYEKLMKEMSRTWEERQKQTEERKQEDLEDMKRSGVSFKVDNKLPNLVNLNDDPQLSEMLLYVLKKGDTTVGRSTDNDIVLTSSLVMKNHCVFHNINDTVTLEPSTNTEANTYINGTKVTNTTVLHHGDRVIIAEEHYFRFNNPLEVESSSTSSNKRQSKGFQYARDEYIKAQTARLESERIRERKEMMKELETVRLAAEECMSEQKLKYEEKLQYLEGNLISKSSEISEREKEKTEAEEKILELLQRNEKLEEETISQKHLIELERMKTQQEYEEMTNISSNLMKELELEKQKLENDIDLLQKNKANRETQKDSNASSIDFIQGSELLRIATMLQEANIISKNLLKHYNFNREENYDNNEVTVKVKVTDTQKNQYTFWSLEKFEARLEIMREIYQHNGSMTSLEADSSQLDTEWNTILGDTSDPFHDPSDEWFPDSFLSTFSPNSNLPAVISPRGTTPQRFSEYISSKTSIPKRLLNTNSSLISSSPNYSLSSPFSYVSPLANDTSLIQIVHEKISTIMQYRNKVFNGGIIEVIMSHIQDMKLTTKCIEQSTNTEEQQTKSLELYTTLQLLLNTAVVLQTLLIQTPPNVILTTECHYTDCIESLINIICHQTALYSSKLLQSILSNSFDETKDCCTNLLDSLNEVISVLAQIVIASQVLQDIPIKLDISISNEDELYLIQNGYQMWCSTFIDKSLQNLHKSIEQLNNIDTVISKLLVQIIYSVYQLLQKISTLQELFWKNFTIQNSSAKHVVSILIKVATSSSLIDEFCVAVETSTVATETATDSNESCLRLNTQLTQLMEQLSVSVLSYLREISYNAADSELQILARDVTTATRSLKKALKDQSYNEFVL